MIWKRKSGAATAGAGAITGAASLLDFAEHLTHMMGVFDVFAAVENAGTFFKRSPLEYPDWNVANTPVTDL